MILDWFDEDDKAPDWFKRWVELWLEPQFDRIANLIQKLGKPGPPVRGKATFIPKGEHVADFTLPDSDTKGGTITVAYTDALGNPADLTDFAANPAWSIDDATIFAITPAADGESCGVALASPAKLGVGTITVDAVDKDGTDVKVVVVGQVVAGEATAGKATFTPNP